MLLGIIALFILAVIAIAVVCLNERNKKDPEAQGLNANPKNDGIMITDDKGSVLFD